MGIFATLRERIKVTPNETNVVVNDDEFEELLDAMEGMISFASDGHGNLVPPDHPESQLDKSVERPIILFGRSVVAPDKSPRTTRTPKPDKPFDAPAGTDKGNSSKFLG